MPLQTPDSLPLAANEGQFEKLPEDRNRLVKEFLDAFLFKDQVKKQLVL